MKKPKKKLKSTKTKPGKKTQFSTLPSVRMQIKGTVLGDPAVENKDTINYNGPLLNDALFRECRDLANKEYNKVLFPLELRGRKFPKGSRPGRMDDLSKVMAKAVRAFILRKQKTPRAKELWSFLEDAHAILEIIRQDRANPTGKELSGRLREHKINVNPTAKQLLHLFPTDKELLEFFRLMAAIQDFDDNDLHWENTRGVTKKTTVGKFNGRLTLIRKNLKK